MTPDQAMQHPWLLGDFQNEISEDTLQKARSNLQSSRRMVDAQKEVLWNAFFV